jgi:formate hydrogenlyase subunit 6/NADH:ubiquinone oxidoreductase subunit I
MFAYFKAIFSGIFSLLSGMAITIQEFFKKDVTLQYPTERWRMCVRICPNNSLEIVQGKGADGKARILDKYIYKLSTCTLCELCVEACNFDAIRMSQDYELSAYDRQDLTLILNEQDYPGKKKAVPAPAPAPVAAPTSL